MICRASLVLVLAAAAPGALAFGVSAREDVGLDLFESRIRPILIERCHDCHARGERSKGGLDLRTRESLLKGGDRGPGIEPGSPSASLLFRAIQGDGELAMPPRDPLEAHELEAFSRWIELGAPWPADDAPAPTAEPEEWWSFRPVADPSPPPVVHADRVANPIDAFVVAKLKGAGLEPVGVAGKRTLLRRVTFDLTGLPPTPEEVRDFVADEAPDAWARVVDRLLDSPRFGETWGRHWLDVARYADTAGDSSDYPIVDAWRYRNWVIDALADDMPYDRFLREQIAGDVLASEAPDERYADRIVATGFLALARRFGVGKDADRHLTIEDTIDTIGRATMGLTMSCARCHDHKFDPITTDDYYGLYGIFASTGYPFPGSENERRPDRLSPLVPTRERTAEEEAFDKALAALERELLRLTGAVASKQREAEAAEARSRQVTEDLAAVDAGAPMVLPQRDEVVAFGTASRSLDAPRGGCVVRFVAPVAGVARLDVSARIEGRVPQAQVRGVPVDLRWCFEGGFWRATGEVDVVAGENELTLAPAPHVTVEGCSADVRTVRLAYARVEPASRAAVAREVARLDESAAAARAQASDLEETRKAKEEELSRHERTKPSHATAYAVYEGEPNDARVQVGGNPRKTGAVVERGFPAVIRGEGAPAIDSGSGRRELAEWLTQPSHPLTARVFVNRAWHHLFGRGLVRTPSNFGLQGAKPTHPELLDWLARRFVEDGWSVKSLLRRILTSRTYQLASGWSERAGATDPDNELLWRHARRRLRGEEVRDALLFTGGSLDLAPGGPHPFPPESKWNWTQHNPFRDRYESQKRTVYSMQQRIRRDPFLALFDGPDTNASTGARGETTVPSQSLFFLNSGMVHDAARSFAARIASFGETDAERITGGFEAAFGRPPAQDEQEAVTAWLADYRGALAGDETPVDDPEHEAWAGFGRTLFAANEFLYLD